MSLPWNEKVVSFQLNPESATIADIVRIAEELVGLRLTIERIMCTASEGPEFLTKLQLADVIIKECLESK
jgi:hypothetical protein